MSPAYGDLPCRFVARVTIQFRTPFVVRTGRKDQRGQSVFVTDANGLPALPGSSIAGVLRHAYTQADFPQAEDLFGPILSERRPEAENTVASRLVVSWGALHDADDRPVEGLSPHADPVLAAARIGNNRDHVAIGPNGAAQDRRKFDEAVVGAGHRFTFELLMLGQPEDSAAWSHLLGLLAWPGLRFGAGSRRGFGAFDLVRVAEGRFDLREHDQFRAFCALPRRLGDNGDLAAIRPARHDALPWIEARLTGLRTTTPWLFSGGGGQGDEDFAPVAETRVMWRDDRGRVEASPQFYLPASGIKGVLAHRVAWHFNRLNGVRAGDGTDIAAHTGQANAAVRSLFGEVKGKDDTGRRGLLVFEDLFLPAAPTDALTWHVSLDRFSGGARAGLLFSERPLDATALPDYTIAIQAAGEVPDLVRQALAATLHDVRRGRLAFGSGGNRGNGGFTCDDITWSDDGTWVRGDHP